MKHELAFRLIGKLLNWSRLCENALEEAAGLAVSAAAVVTQHVEFLGEGPAPYAFIAAISGPAPRILIARFRL